MADRVAPAHAFDGVADRYDETFTNRQLGRWLRDVVWRELDAAFSPGDTVLDLGCGTGEDACHLAQTGVAVVATDASTVMLDVARSKALRGGVDDRITLTRLDLMSVNDATDLTWLFHGRSFDGAHSNFGPLNCVPDRRPLARALGAAIKPGGTLIAVVMGPVCPWEIGWYLLHGHPRTSGRRFRRGVHSRVGNEDIRVWYPSPRRLRSELRPEFAHVRTIGVGIFLPPSDLGRLVARAPGLSRWANGLDERWRGRFPWTWLNDHYLTVFRRRDGV
jgi:ubiquinone/menaquinone biosynthesis C-methylase UbiE